MCYFWCWKQSWCLFFNYKIKQKFKLEARGKPSTWLPRGGLVEHIFWVANQPTKRPTKQRTNQTKSDKLIYEPTITYERKYKKKRINENQHSVDPNEETDEQTNQLTDEPKTELRKKPRNQHMLKPANSFNELQINKRTNGWSNQPTINRTDEQTNQLTNKAIET